MHVAVTRQGARVRVYLNQEKLWDVPRALLPAAKYNAILFFIPNVDAGSEYFVSNVRLAVGAPDTRNKLLTQGKWVTNGILFDVNSDRIRGESYGTLKEIAGVLTENADLKVQIVGHTDSDGETAANLDLSRRRAASVKTALTTEFKHRRGPHGHRRQGRERAGGQGQHPSGQGQQSSRRVHQEVRADMNPFKRIAVIASAISAVAVSTRDSSLLPLRFVRPTQHRLARRQRPSTVAPHELAGDARG